jgi:hypothetical protein
MHFPLKYGISNLQLVSYYILTTNRRILGNSY